MPAYLRGEWIFYLLLVGLGAFLYIGRALLLGLAAFIATAFFLFYRMHLGDSVDQLVLIMFMTPIAPLWLSAVRHNLNLRRQANSAYLEFNHRSNLQILNIDAYADFQQRLISLCNRFGVDAYSEIKIDILNDQLIAEMLGEHVWRKTRIRILEILRAHADDAIFHFSDDQLTFIHSICPHPADTDIEPAYIAELRQIVELKLRVVIKKTIIQPHTIAAKDQV